MQEPRTATVELENGSAFSFSLFASKAPKTVENFITKANAGFYDGLTFHRVVPGFVIQGGDPDGNGTGGGTQPTELSDLPFRTGALGVARGGDITVSNDSQWFVCLGDAPHLDGKYTNFGQVTSGQEAVAKVTVGTRIKKVTVA